MKKLLKKYPLELFFLFIVLILITITITTLYYNSKYQFNNDIKKIDLYNIDNLIIVSHPQDEILWSSTKISKGNNLVVCISCQKYEEDTKNFIKVMKYTNNKFLTLSYPEYKDDTHINWNTYKKDITKDIKTIIEYKNWNSIITHNPNGEYGNIHHKIISKIVTNNTKDKELLYYNNYYYSKKEITNYQNILTKIDTSQLKTKYKLLSFYNNKELILDNYNHILPYEETIPYRKWVIDNEKTK